MVDITKCGGFNCPIKTDCYRFTSPKGFWQSWFAVRPGEYRKIDGKDVFSCSMFWNKNLDLEKEIFDK